MHTTHTQKHFYFFHKGGNGSCKALYKLCTSIFGEDWLAAERSVNVRFYRTDRAWDNNRELWSKMMRSGNQFTTQKGKERLGERVLFTWTLGSISRLWWLVRHGLSLTNAWWERLMLANCCSIFNGELTLAPAVTMTHRHRKWSVHLCV